MNCEDPLVSPIQYGGRRERAGPPEYCRFHRRKTVSIPLRPLMPKLPSLRLPVVLIGASLILVPGCFDEDASGPTLPPEDGPAEPTSTETGPQGWIVGCQVDVTAGDFTCGDPSSDPDSIQGEVIGGQDQYVTLANDPVELNGSILTADVWVENLLPQPIGTPDRTTATGIRVFFHSAPTNGVTINNADGTGTFTASGQDYFEYSRIAEPFDRTVRKPWEFVLPQGVTAFTFQVYVDADVPLPDGWVEITPGTDGLAESESVQLTAQAYSLVGDSVNRSFTWSTADASIVSVDGSGTITGEATGGPVTISAASDGPEPDGQAVFTVGGNDIGVSVVAIPDAAEEGGLISHIVSVTNNGPTPVSDVLVRLSINGTVFRQSFFGCGYIPASSGSPGNQLFQCSTGQLTDGQSTSFTLTVQATSAETVTSTAYLYAINSSTDLTSDPNTGNNSFDATTIVEDIPDADLSIALADNPDPVYAGEQLDYTTTISNPGTEAADSVVVEVVVDGNGDATRANFPSECLFGSYGDGDLLYRCTVGPVPGGGSIDVPVLTVDIGTGLIAPDISATATLQTVFGVYDANTANNSDTEPTSVIDDPDLVPSNLVISPGEVFDDDNAVQIDARITNESTVGTGSGFDWRIDVAGNPVANGSESALAAGGFVDITASGLGPFTAGDNLVELIVDVNDAVAEKDETNNTLPDTLFVQEPGFQIELVYVSSFTANQQSIINAAATRWESIITGDLPSEYIEFFPPQPYCPEDFVGNVDDLKVWVYTTDHSSGSGGVLAFAGPWFLRTSELAACGAMYFDINDLSALESDGRLGDVAGHELAHVLGIGTIWDDNPNITNDPVDLLGGVGTTDPYFAGPQAISQFNAAGGSSYTGNKVPVQDEEGYGHWRESVMDTELMTPFAEAPSVTNEWSLITAGAFEDMGYQVDLSSTEIDSYTLTLPSVLAESQEGPQQEFDDIVLQPRFIRLPDGRVIQLKR